MTKRVPFIAVEAVLEDDNRADSFIVTCHPPPGGKTPPQELEAGSMAEVMALLSAISAQYLEFAIREIEAREKNAINN